MLDAVHEVECKCNTRKYWIAVSVTAGFGSKSTLEVPGNRSYGYRKFSSALVRHEDNLCAKARRLSSKVNDSMV